MKKISVKIVGGILVSVPVAIILLTLAENPVILARAVGLKKRYIIQKATNTRNT